MSSSCSVGFYDSLVLLRLALALGGLTFTFLSAPTEPVQCAQGLRSPVEMPQVPEEPDSPPQISSEAAKPAQHDEEMQGLPDQRLDSETESDHDEA